MCEEPSRSVAAALAWARSRLGPDGRDAEYLLATLLGQRTAQLRAFGERTLTPQQWLRFQALVERRADGEPVAYLTGQREFWSLPLEVGRGVLVPRADSELLVQTALERLPADCSGVVADVGCGSANLALALSAERPALTLLALDIDCAALHWARRNVAALGHGRCLLLQGDLLSAVQAGTLHAVVANLPYIEHGDGELEAATARHEPARALYAAEGGLALIRQLAAQARSRLRPGSWLLLEHGWRQADAVRQLLQVHGYRECHSLADLAGHPRVSLGRNPG